MSIPFIDLEAQFRALEPAIRARMDRVLAHGRFILGPEIAELEEALARIAGVRHVVSCSSGTDALLMVLMARGIGPGDAVFTSTFSFIASAEVISLLGATPVFVDVDPHSFNLDPGKLAGAVAGVREAGRLTPRAIIPVDLFGLPADYDAIEALARAEDLFVLEDAAQSFGAAYRGRRAGSLGGAAATSFFPAKPLGCYGDGGAVLTDDDALAERVRSIRMHGKGVEKYDNVRIGINGRLDTLQAAVLLAKLEAFPAELEAREAIAARYGAALGEALDVPRTAEGSRSAWALYSVLSPRRDALRRHLDAAGIPTAVYYPKPLHLQTAFAPLGHRAGEFPVAEAVCGRILSLPMHPYLAPEVQDRIIAAVLSAGTDS